MREIVRRLTREKLVEKVGLPPKTESWLLEFSKPKTSCFKYTTGEITR